MTTVLLVEDDPAIAVPLSRVLTREGYRVAHAASGGAAVEVFTGGRGPGGADAIDVDVVILDLGLPDVDGLEVCRRIRAAAAQVPVLMLTARTDEADLIVGLDAGADDYVGKPFRMAELLARIRALLRRRTPALLEVSGVRMETAARRVEVDGAEITLANKEFELLRVMMSRAGQVVTREEILAEVWNDPGMKSTKTLDMHMSWLRRKLAGATAGEAGDGGTEPTRISTVRGIGFRFEVWTPDGADRAGSTGAGGDPGGS
ncbi:response regulator transcription factor [Nakamurella leprariae]|uniref:Response regulator transcription factor n=1 Tax=Nakamurella leprariae TaxID=2803911 RepID=A0A938YBQ8_9ACTN|nr:response regulator transcription factor [Nakamurella leprariae]